MSDLIPVIAIDGPSASGKGSVAMRVAKHLGFHYLDSGAIYRIVAFAAYKRNIAWDNAAQLGELANQLDVQFKQGHIYLQRDRITEIIRTEQFGRGASEVAVHPTVREALVTLQKNFRKAPGLVADGRDMGSVIFPDSALKIFLTAAVETRADRRYQQLINRGEKADYDTILADLQQRDIRDSQRTSAPLMQTKDALLLDTSEISIEEATDFILSRYKPSI